MKRKTFLQYFGFLLATVWAPGKAKSKSSSCVTDKDVEGPFFRAGAPIRNELAAKYRQSGQPLMVKGRVMAPDCSTPIAGVTIDLWHAGPDGKYDLDSSDYNFRGRIYTDSNGNYSFKTLLPIGYKDGPLDRPAHIHYMISAKGFKNLTTQLYFKDDPKLHNDVFIIRNNGTKRAMPYPKDDKGTCQITFDIVLDVA